MGLFNLFRPRPKVCTTCGNESPGLHHVYSGTHHGVETDRLCTGCLMARLGSQIKGKTILFVEPLTGDGYCFSPLAEVDSPVAAARMQMALASMKSECSICMNQATQLWLPQADTDYQAMEQQPAGAYWCIPLAPAHWTGTLALCDAHLLEHLATYLAQKRYYFGTFRYPDASETGCYT